MTYELYIQNILNTRGQFGISNDEYHERHHIIPKCMGGNNNKDNLIDLYAREHFIAHKLLAEENPTNRKVVIAWWMIAHCKSDEQDRYELSPEEYEKAKIAFSNSQKGANNPMYGKGFKDKDHPNYGKVGELSPKYGTHLSEETKDKIRQKAIGRTASDETKRKLSEQRQGKNNCRAFPIYCPELDEEFWGAKDAQDKYGVNRNKISLCVNGKRKHAGVHPVTGEKLSWVKLENKNS